MTLVVTAQKVHFMTKNHRGRFREHLSTNYDQLCFRLETSGITLDKDMFLSNGMLGLDLHKECFKFRTSSEQQQHQNKKRILLLRI